MLYSNVFNASGYCQSTIRREFLPVISCLINRPWCLIYFIRIFQPARVQCNKLTKVRMI